MFREISSLPLKILDKEYLIAVGINVEEGMTDKEMQEAPILCALFKVENESYIPYEDDDSQEYKQIAMTGKVYTKGFVDGCQTTISTLNIAGKTIEDKPKLEI